jgi:ribosomal protein L11 methyltransferase
VTDWVEIIVPVGAADVDDVAALVAAEVPSAIAGTEQRGDEVVYWVPVDEAPRALEELRATVARWAASGLAVDPDRVRAAAATPEAEWRDAWKRYFRVARLTRQLVVVPSWERFTSQADDRVIELDPGMAFGTGTHASTRLVLEELQVLADAGTGPTSVLDVGCGSGILSIAALKLWPNARAVAIDIDPLAVAATCENAERNAVAPRLAASPASVGELGDAFPLVLANIQAHVLRELHPALVSRTAAGGTLILSGLLTPQAEPLADELVAAGMQRVRVRPSADDAQWSAVVLRRP